MNGCETRNCVAWTRATFALALLGCIFALLNCARAPDNPYTHAVTIRVVDEAGEPIRGARVDIDGRLLITNADGEVEVDELYGPSVALVDAGGYLTEPLAIDRSDAERPDGVEVRLFAEAGPTGTPRWVMHSGGDAMFGRRYLEPPDGLPTIPVHDIAGGARAIVSDLARVFGIADFAVLNLECVVADLPDSAIYPAKRFILRSPPESLAALDELSVDLVTLGNNHTRDYLDEGVRHTLASLDAIAMPWVGAADGDTIDVNPIVVEPISGIEMSVFSFTTVDGDFVNDSYADADEPVPAACSSADAPAECFMFEARSWGCEGASVAIPTATRRAGPAWRAYADAEGQMSAADQAACWASLAAVYPEMQDWAARRGHGGASPWAGEDSRDAISLASTETDLVMIQLHAGFQFQTAPSNGIKTIAYETIDAGADIVIAHHPHVLQGVEWYRGKLILYSLGNFVFDQDFLATFSSAFLRTVWEGRNLIEARLIPLELVGYRPIVTTGPAAARTIETVWESSATPAYTARDANDDVRRHLADADALDPDAEVAHLRLRNHTGLIGTAAPMVDSVEVEIPQTDAIAAIDYRGLIHAQAGGADVLIGRELFGWGHLEDALADDVARPAAQWFMPEGRRTDPVLRLDSNAAGGFGWIEMYRDAGFSGDTFARPIARIPVPAHRLYRDTGVSGDVIPDDGEASYTIQLHAKLRGEGVPFIRLEFFYFDDTDPTEDPLTVPVGGPLDLPLELEPSEDWQVASVDVDPSVLVHDGLRANVVLVRVRFGPPEAGESVLGIDDFGFIEWRPAAQMQDHFGDYDFVRGDAGTIMLEGMALD